MSWLLCRAYLSHSVVYSPYFEMTMTVSSENAVPPKSTKSRYSGSTVSRGTNSNWDLDLYRGIWVSQSGGFQWCSIFSGICHVCVKWNSIVVVCPTLSTSSRCLERVLWDTCVALFVCSFDISICFTKCEPTHINGAQWHQKKDTCVPLSRIHLFHEMWAHTYKQCATSRTRTQMRHTLANTCSCTLHPLILRPNPKP
jgi:hypothetical protein